MKLSPITTLIAAGVLALAGCSSTPTKVDHGPIKARTFSFVDQSARSLPANTEARREVHVMIQDAITKDLASQGVTKKEAGGDVTVAYMIIVGNNVATTSVNDYFGYGRDADALLDKAHKAYTSNKNPNAFEAGTLLIDIIDGKSFKLLERNYATRQILKDLPADAREKRIQEVVDEALRQVRFVQ